jgi:hypothetical protein
MAQVSEQAEELLSQLLAWELGATELDPKIILRQVPLADLAVVLSNVGEEDAVLADTSVSLRLVFLEHEYRVGHLGGDWDVEKNGLEVFLKIPMKTPIKMVRLHLLEDSCS